MEKEKAIEKIIEIMDEDKHGVCIDLVKTLNLNTKQNSPQTYYNVLEKMIEEKIERKIDMKKILSEVIKMFIISIPQAIIIYLILSKLG